MALHHIDMPKDKLRELLLSGLTPIKIVQNLGCYKSAIYGRIHYHRLEEFLPSVQHRRAGAKIFAQLKVNAAQGHTLTMAAKKLGLPMRIVLNTARLFGGVKRQRLCKVCGVHIPQKYKPRQSLLCAEHYRQDLRERQAKWRKRNPDKYRAAYQQNNIRQAKRLVSKQACYNT